MWRTTGRKKTVLEKWLNFGCSKDSNKLCASPLLFNYLTDTDGRKGRFFFQKDSSATSTSSSLQWPSSYTLLFNVFMQKARLFWNGKKRQPAEQDVFIHISLYGWKDVFPKGIWFDPCIFFIRPWASNDNAYVRAIAHNGMYIIVRDYMVSRGIWREWDKMHSLEFVG